MTNTNNGSDRLNLLTDQIGRLTEQIAQSNIVMTNGFAGTRANIEKLGEKIDSGFSELKNGLSELKTIAQAQQQDINRLVEVTDKLVDTTARQEQDINRLVAVTDRQTQTVDRLSLMLERLMSDSR